MISEINKKIFLGMSGGVDSSVCAHLLKEQGYEVVGVYMKNWSDEFGIEGDCPWEQDVRDVEDVCSQLGIEFRSYNFEKIYRDRVITDFFDKYSKGLTPNPDILCNKEIKFDAFLTKCLEDGADMIATGHYARVMEDERGFHLLKGVDNTKDQSYFLSSLNKFQLSKTIFPLGELKKSEVRMIAKEISLKVAEKKDSQGICFIGKIDVGKFLRENIAYHPGKIVEVESGEILGEHDGVAFYTIGQRQGLKIGGIKPNQDPFFVCGKDIVNNILYVCSGNQNKRLFSESINVNEIDWISGKEIFEKLPIEFECSVSIRYRQSPVRCKFTKSSSEMNTVHFITPVRAVSPGQSAVFYSGNEVLGRGTII